MAEQMFSVAMCVYGADNPQWFCRAVDSVLNQTRRPDEVVLVVDGPVPEMLDAVICTYAEDPLFQIIRLKNNSGHGFARQVALSHCTYDLVALMDADDISDPHRFEWQLKEFVKQPELAIIGGQITEFFDDPQNIVAARTVLLTDHEIKLDMKKRCPMNQVTVMFRKSAVEQAGGYIDWFYEEDYYLWLRMSLMDMIFGNLPQNLVNVRVGKQMYRRRGGWKYFSSEAKLQNYMLKQKIINPLTWCANVAKRFIVQVLLPNRVRSWVFQKFARKTV